MKINLSTNYNQNRMKDENNIMDLVRTGTRQLAEEFEQQQEARRKAENVETVEMSGADNVENMTQEQKLDLLTKAVADLTLKLDGGNNDGE